MKSIYIDIKNKISFNKVFTDICIVEMKHNNYKCPFCMKEMSFSILNDNYGKCFYDKCDWSGDVIQLYMDYKNKGLMDTIDHFDTEYNLNIDFSKYDKTKLEIERGKYIKRLSDIKFIRQFRVMMSVLNYEKNFISDKLGVTRKYFSLILNEKIDHKDISEKKYNVIIGLMYEFYKEKNDLMLNHMDLYFSDYTLDLVKKVNKYINQIYG